MTEIHSLERIQQMLSDPAIEAAENIIKDLQKKNLVVYFNPKFGTVLVGRSKGYKATSTDINLAWEARHEIGLVFALRTFSNHYAAEKEANRVLDNFKKSFD